VSGVGSATILHEHFQAGNARSCSRNAVRELAHFVSKLPAPEPVSDAPDPARIQRAEMLARKNHCIICHKPDFSGGINVPRLAGQREDYLVKALRGYKDNSRRGYDASMAYP
jgi:cytochrome c553